MSLDATLDVAVGGFHLMADLRVGSGEVVALLGPNGSGKSTALKALAGLIALDQGRITLDEAVLDDPAAGAFVAPADRAVSLVFQDYLLFPHLRAVDNVAFGLRARGSSRSESRREAQQWLERFGLGDRAHERVRQLSGGQAQRVALARALAPRPRLLLLDEPLAALDAATRSLVRRDLRAHLDDFAGPTVLVTHDPLDALALATSVVVLEAGVVSQAGPIGQLATHPRSRYVADLVGLNLLDGTAVGTTVHVRNEDGTTSDVTVADAADGPVFALIHPRTVAIHTIEPEGSPRNQWPGRVEGFDLLGDRVRVRIAGPLPLVAEVTPAAVSALDLHEGRPVWTAVKATEITTYPR